MNYTGQDILTGKIIFLYIVPIRGQSKVQSIIMRRIPMVEVTYTDMSKRKFATLADAEKWAKENDKTPMLTNLNAKP